MKTTGIVRRLDDLGRIVIPKEIRRTCGIVEGDPLEIAIEDGNIILTPYRPYKEDEILAELEMLAGWYENIDDNRHAEELRRMKKDLLKKQEQSQI